MPLRRTLSLLANITVARNVLQSLSIFPRLCALPRQASSCVRISFASVLLLLLATLGLLFGQYFDERTDGGTAAAV